MLLCRSVWASLKNMPGHGGNRTYDLRNTSPMLCQLSYAVRSVRICDISELSLAEDWASIPKVVGSIPPVAIHIFQACPVWIYTQSRNITSIIFTWGWVHYTNTEKKSIVCFVRKSKSESPSPSAIAYYPGGGGQGKWALWLFTILGGRARKMGPLAVLPHHWRILKKCTEVSRYFFSLVK